MVKFCDEWQSLLMKSPRSIRELFSLPGFVAGTPVLVLIDRRFDFEAAAQGINDAIARGVGPVEPDREVVLVGIDERTLSVLPQPMALWHPHWRALLEGLKRQLDPSGALNPGALELSAG